MLKLRPRAPLSPPPSWLTETSPNAEARDGEAAEGEEREGETSETTSQTSGKCNERILGEADPGLSSPEGAAKGESCSFG